MGLLQFLSKHNGVFDPDDEQICTLAAHCARGLLCAMLLEPYVIKQTMEHDLSLAPGIQMGALPNASAARRGHA